MDGLDLSNPAFMGSVLLAAIILAVMSGIVQMYGSEHSPDESLNFKGMLRDGILGGIFTTMAWVLLPDTMNSLTSIISSGVQSATTTAAAAAGAGATATSALSFNQTGGSFTPDLQIGPPRF
jgi:hypothetical protein